METFNNVATGKQDYSLDNQIQNINYIGSFLNNLEDFEIKQLSYLLGVMLPQFENITLKSMHSILIQHNYKNKKNSFTQSVN